MERTGVYGKPIYAILEGAFDSVVANVQHVKRVPGRKADERFILFEGLHPTIAGTQRTDPLSREQPFPPSECLMLSVRRKGLTD